MAKSVLIKLEGWDQTDIDNNVDVLVEHSEYYEAKGNTVFINSDDDEHLLPRPSKL